MMLSGKQKMSVFPGMQHEVGNKNIQDREAQTNNKIMGPMAQLIWGLIEMLGT